MKRATRIEYAGTIEGTYEGKPYCSGRVLVSTIRDGQDTPAYMVLSKCSPEIAEELALHTPCYATLYYDAYKQIVGFKEIDEI